MIGIIAAMGGEIEGDGKPFLAGGEIAPVKGVGILRRGEARILADGPGLRDIHGRIGAAHERRDAGEPVDERKVGDVFRPVGILDFNALGREPSARLMRLWGGGGRGEGNLRKIRDRGHRFLGCSLNSHKPHLRATQNPCFLGDFALQGHRLAKWRTEQNID